MSTHREEQSQVSVSRAAGERAPSSSGTLLPVLRRLLLPLAVGVLALVAGFFVATYRGQRLRLERGFATVVVETERSLRRALDLQASGLSAAVKVLETDAGLRDALADRDTGRLLSEYRPLFLNLRRDHGITHFYLHDPNRVNLLRLHKPDKHGDLIDRFTAKEAASTWRTSTGIELGPLGTFTLRAVSPVDENGRIIGFVELGKEIEELLAELHASDRVEIVVAIHKDALDRAAWEAGMRMLGREGAWDRFSDVAVIYSSLAPLPVAFDDWVSRLAAPDGAGRDAPESQLLDGRHWHGAPIRLDDAGGTPVGSLLVLQDSTAEMAALTRHAVLAGALSVGVLVVAFSLLYALLRDADKQIRGHQRRVREREEHLAATLRSIGDGVISTDASGTVIRMNAVAESLTGWSSQEAAGKPITEVFRIFSSETREAAPDPVARALRDGAVVGLANHTVLAARDGTERQIADSCAPIHGPSDEVLGAVLVFRDVTEDYEHGERLRRSEERLRSYFENAPHGIFIAGPDGRFQETNPAGCALLGYSEEELAQRAIWDVLAPESRKEGEASHRRQHERGRDYTQLTLMRKDGTPVEVALAAVALPDGRRLGFCLDITDRIRAEQALAASRERFMLAVDGSNDGIWDWDLRDNSLFLSKRWKEMLGYEDDELPNVFDSFAGNVHPDDKPELMRYVNSYLSGELEEYSIEFRMRHKDGSYRWILARGSAVRDETGKPFRMAGSHTDITDRKQWELDMRASAEKLERTNAALEEAIRRANQLALDAERANAAKSEFLANMSHEIRTPMNGVIGMTGLLMDTELDEEQRHYASIIQSSGNSLLELVNDILDFSKIEADRLELENLEFDLRIALEETIDLLAIRAEAKGLELLFDVDPNVPALLKGDPGRLRQILINLAGNAIKFTSEGEVAVRVSLEAETDKDARIRFIVRDTGIGIPKDKTNILFDSFRQVDGSTTRQYGGTGLGLAICKRLVEMMRGTIGVESEVGEGSTFWFTAVLMKQPESAQDALPPALAVLRGTHMLVVDDNATNRDVLGRMLALWGVRYEEAASREDALALAQDAADRDDPYRVAILDMQMPGGDGESLGCEIKAMPTLAPTALVMMSSVGRRGDAARLADEGFAAYLLKPVKRSELHDCLATVLGEGQAGAAAPRRLVTRHSIREDRRRRVRVLVAEDNVSNQQVAIGILRKLGLHADAVANGEEAVTALATAPYDLVLMDVHMPEMDGLQATRAIRDPGSPVADHHVPVVAMTASATKEDRERCFAAGMDDFMSKPITPDRLADVLARWVRDGAEAEPAEADAEGGRPGGGHQAEGSDAASLQGDPAETAVFDRAGFVDRLMGDETLATQILQRYVEDIPGQIALLKEHLAAGNEDGAIYQAHTIKGAAASVGAPQLQAAASDVEQTSRQSDLRRASRLCRTLEERFEEFRRFVEDEPPPAADG